MFRAASAHGCRSPAASPRGFLRASVRKGEARVPSKAPRSHASGPGRSGPVFLSVRPGTRPRDLPSGRAPHTVSDDTDKFRSREAAQRLPGPVAWLSQKHSLGGTHSVARVTAEEMRRRKAKSEEDRSPGSSPAAPWAPSSPSTPGPAAAPLPAPLRAQAQEPPRSCALCTGTGRAERRGTELRDPSVQQHLAASPWSLRTSHAHGARRPSGRAPRVRQEGPARPPHRSCRTRGHRAGPPDSCPRGAPSPEHTGQGNGSGRRARAPGVPWGTSR